jgi:hypothetical protein
MINMSYIKNLLNYIKHIIFLHLPNSYKDPLHGHTVRIVIEPKTYKKDGDCKSHMLQVHTGSRETCPLLNTKVQKRVAVKI